MAILQEKEDKNKQEKEDKEQRKQERLDKQTKRGDVQEKGRRESK